MGFKLNADLARYLRDHPKRPVQPPSPPPRYNYTPPRWRVRDRLSKADIANLIVAFKAGASK